MLQTARRIYVPGHFQLPEQPSKPVFAGVIGFAAAGFAPQIFHDGDTWWHLAAGQWMLDHRQVLKTDVFSFTFFGRVWDAQEWLSEILMALSFRLGGWSGVHLLFGLAAGGDSGPPCSRGAATRIAAMPALLVSLVGLACLSGSLLARPHLLALPLLAAWTLGLLRAARDKAGARLVAGPGDAAMGQSAWQLRLRTGAGGGFRAGSGDRGAAPASRDWGLLFYCGIVARRRRSRRKACDGTGCSPSGCLMLGSIGNVGEWAPTSLTRTGALPHRAGRAFYMLGPERPDAAESFLAAGLLIVIGPGLIWSWRMSAIRCCSASSCRMLVGGRACAQRWPATRNGSCPQVAHMPPLGAGLLAVLILARLVLPTARGDDRVTPMSALASVSASLRGQPVLNGYDFGGYLIFSGVKVFVDGRTDMYGDAFLADYDRMMRPDRKALSDALARWHIAWSILPPGPAAAMMDSMPGWHRAYGDQFAVVHIRRNP